MMNVNFRTLDLNLLRVFDEVMAERNLTRAARNLALTQPAVSNALRRLRDVLGDELVRRAGGGVEPTPRALALWPAVRDALQQLQDTLAPSDLRAGHRDTSFVLAMADATAAELVPGLVQITEKRSPGRLAARGAADHARPAPPAGERGGRHGDRLLSGRAGRPDRARPAGRGRAVRGAAAVRRPLRVRDAARPSAGAAAADARRLLRRAAPAGELLGPALRLHRPDARRAGARSGTSRSR